MVTDHGGDPTIISSGYGMCFIFSDITLSETKCHIYYPLAREGVWGPGGTAFLAHVRQKFHHIVGLTALWLAFFMGYE